MVGSLILPVFFFDTQTLFSYAKSVSEDWK